MVPRFTSRAVALCAFVVAVSFACLGQDTHQDASQAPAAPSATVQSDSSADPRAKIDELLKQAYEQINVDVQFQKAAETAQQALDLSQKIGDKSRASTAMNLLSAAYGYGGRIAEAFEVAQKNVIVARETGDKRILEQALNTVGSVAGGQGRYEESLGYFYECLAVAREASDTTMEYMSDLNIGEAYVESGEPDRAEAPLQESLRLAAKLNNGDLEAANKSKKATEMALLNLGGMEVERHRYRAALTYYEKVHDNRPESSLWVITALEGMAEAHEHLGQPAQAIGLLQEAMPLAEKAGSRAQSVRLVSRLGVNQETLGNFDAALASQNRALSLVHQGGDPGYEWQIESRIGHVNRSLGRNEEALQHYRKAIDGIERLRTVALNTDEGRAGVLARSRETYLETSDLLYDLERASEALEVSEHGRARGFMDMLSYASAEPPGQLGPQQKEREHTLRAHIAGIERELWKEDLPPQQQRQRKRELAAAEQDLDAFQIEMRRENPQYANIHYPEPISTRQIQDRLPDEQTALLEFQLGDKRSLVWLVSKGRIRAATLPNRKAIEGQVSAYRALLTQRASTLTFQQSLPEIERRGHELYNLLLQPLTAAMSPYCRLIIVPDGTLEYLPFETLVSRTHHQSKDRDAFEYLIKRFSIVYTPSASSLAEIEATRKNTVPPAKELLAFGDPVVRQPSQPTASAGADATRSENLASSASPTEEYVERGFSLTQLPNSRAEAVAISRLFPARQRDVYLGSEARIETLKAIKLDDYRYIHFASHAFVDEGSPVRSGIVFSPDTNSSSNGILQVRDIMRLKLNADLVTLSACSTGLGKLVTGEGVLGLTRAFFYAGASNLTVSLWNVNDSATATLMTNFYLNLKRGLPKAAALREAKLSLLRGDSAAWRHPYYWAPFVLVGEGR